MATFIHHTHVSVWLRRGISHLNNKRSNTFLIRCLGQNPRYSSTMARTYESALMHLQGLQSNRAITSLFSPPAIPTSPETSASASPKQDLNALAIPEMLAWLQRSGISQDDLAAKLRCIHVAGTKGKGSVCAYLTALLTHGDDEVKRAAGKVGTYTSPHLVSVRERIAIDGAPISRELFTRYFFEVWDACTEAARAELFARRAKGEEEEISESELQGPATKPFYFRFLTIVALRAFLGEGVHSAVIECGIGGEYDSTNILPTSSITASVVTQLGIDHVGMLGGTLPEIAWHKAGVCKSGRKCFTKRLEGKEGTDAATITAETMQVLQQRAKEKGATLVEVEDTDVERWGGVKASEKGAGSLEGDFQKYNQALAVHAAREHLRVLAAEASNASGEKAMGVTMDEKLEDIPPSFISALQYARLRGRCETWEDKEAPITWYIDGAHTAESLAAVAQWFAGKVNQDTSKARKILLFNQQDRDAAKLVSGLLRDIKANVYDTSDREEKPLFTNAIFTRNDLQPRILTSSGRVTEPPRDLSVQEAAADAFCAAYPSTTANVVDNVLGVVLGIRDLANRQTDGRRTMVLATGSLHLVGALLQTLEPDAEY
ncbi:FolC bifunctional protein [Nemania abortiva]|nr:FolC bifunctional protein [Nemania abortiva]